MISCFMFDDSFDASSKFHIIFHIKREPAKAQNLQGLDGLCSCFMFDDSFDPSNKFHIIFISNEGRRMMKSLRDSFHNLLFHV